MHYLAQKIVVVGDDKQISPQSWLEKADVQLMRERLINDVPHSSNIGSEDSFFDLAEIRFSGRIRLREHFRCMPEIIQFSNDLCYQSEPLIPLKQFGNSRLIPPVIALRVSDGFMEGSAGRTWNPNEAKALVNQMNLIVNDPLYSNKTIGVISLLGELQAKKIEELLIKELGPEEMEKRELRCGDAYAFQGDERDIIFLSMVSAPTEGRTIGVLSKAEDQRRFNVAASRAREQMWLFHSADLADLNPNCLRYKFLEYCQNPRTQAAHVHGLKIFELQKLAKDARRSVTRPPAPFDSWFEIDVYLQLYARNLQIVPQYEIAGRRIDMVVELANRKFAIECDGDHWHGADVYEADLARQRDLQRCGFRFWRVRESAFYLNPEKAMSGLWELLEEYTSSNQIQKNTQFASQEELPNQIEDITHQTQNVVTANNEEPNSASEKTDADLLKMPSHELCIHFQKCIAAHGPMRASCLYKLVCRLHGIQRLGSRIQSHFNKVISKLAKDGKLEIRDELNCRQIVDRYVFNQSPNQTIYTRGPRDLEDIPPSEIALVAKLVSSKIQPNGQSPSKDTLLKAVSEHYGYERLRSSMMDHLDAGWQVFENGRIGKGIQSVEVRASTTEDSPPNITIPQFLNELSLEIIDKRASNGALWIIDDPKIRDLLPMLGARGIIFNFAEKGTDLTGYRPAWWTKKIS